MGGVSQEMPPDGTSRRELMFELLEAGFPGLGWQTRLARMRALGVPWEEVSVPFMRFEDGVAVSHVGVMPLTLVVMGERLSAGAVHAVCTHPDYRRRGHFRACFEDALRYCDSRFETLLLTTAQPELYEPFGFRVVGEHRFVKTLGPRAAAARAAVRELRGDSADDLRLLKRLLDGREPISRVVGAPGEVKIFAFNETFRPLLYAEDLDLIISAEVEGTTLHLFDLVGSKLHPLEEIAGRIAADVERAFIYFSPDRICDSAAAEPHLLDGDDHLMVRGPFPAEGRPFMLPRTTRC